ncbi:DUF5107 domain-containing protein [Amycolatopsis sp. 195334CR]|uniref:DUF5107 domain-containing protein n=1 Tax=Amycolatopsis sp. 195334CR TaxID=2814588 RepID=UPI001A8F3A20|nr:DUF5107 domain-containing protein [Amycolatopsis sp. 195334CR]MBN6040184.1 DUF5107 domain-containing protein [Amycolatopsis sp. 195334CR]
MTRVFRTELVLPVASIGPENPLPPLRPLTAAQQVTNVDELPPDLADGVRYGKLDSVLPCLVRNGYGRERTEQALPALVLENAKLRATVLPSLGGRLYSLHDKVRDRELLFRNPVLQPANLALRDAWFAGGVEWNLGSTGHTTMTCEPMHAARVGTDGLRLWEWERTRNLPYQLDFRLPEESPVLLVGVRVRNPHEHEVPLYWWSNIAVPQTPGTRVLAPARHAWHYGYGGHLDRVPMPAEIDPNSYEHAADFFFDLEPGQRPWIAAVDETGYGLRQTSTGLLRGRKLFVWGSSEGGRRWQEWLSPDSEHGYLEIQAGLARTQLEHLRLPGGESREWLETYGPVDASYPEWQVVADEEPGEWLHTGSGWGALEQRRTPRSLPGTPFPDSTLGERQQPWLDLLTGKMAAPDPLTPPDGTLVTWRAELEAAEPNWLVWYHRGVAHWYAGDETAAEQAWRASLDEAENPWALRNLAVATDDASLLNRAFELAPAELAVEAIEAALAAGQAEEALALLAAVPVRTGRIELLTARALLAAGDAAGAEDIYLSGFDVPDIREGDTSLSDTWAEIQRALGGARPLPRRYDFRMAAP